MRWRLPDRHSCVSYRESMLTTLLTTSVTTFVLQFLIYQIASANVDCNVNDDNYCVATCEVNGVTVTLDISHIVEYP